MANWVFDLTGAPHQRNELELKLRTEILALEAIGRGDEIHGTVTIAYSDDDAKNAAPLAYPQLQSLHFDWRKSSPH